MAGEDESKISAAVAVSADVSGPSGKELAQWIEDAMSQAVRDASAEGLNVDTDAAEVRARMMAARQRVLDEVARPRGDDEAA